MARKILEISPIYFERYNGESCYRARFTQASLEALRDKYHQIRGQPGFVDDILHLASNSASVQMLRERPELIKWSDAGDVLILPNYETYNEMNRIGDLIRNPRKMKDRPGGLEFTVWFIHPKQLEETVFSEPAKRASFEAALEGYDYVPGLAPQNRMERRENQMRIWELEERSGIPYLASMLDLKPEHAPWLREMKRLVLDHLQNVYGVGDQDLTHLFFHKAIGEPTTTLHLQVRVNQALHPFEEHSSISLDELISGLERGKTGVDLFLEHDNGTFYHAGYKAMVDMCEGLPDIEFNAVPNPFRQESRAVKVETPGQNYAGRGC